MSHVITLLTDFGTFDTYVAQMKGVILGIAPQCQIIDASHQIAPQDIMAGARALREYAMLYPAGTVHVAVVDPGVGTDRRIIAARIEEQKFVLPDNGLISVLAAEWPVPQAVVVTRPQFFRPTVSRTFHGRDMMAPVAAHLALGLSLEELGPPAGELVRLVVEKPDTANATVIAEIVSVDRFGNAITNIPASWLHSVRRHDYLILDMRGNQTRVAIVDTYGEREPGALVALASSQGRVELAIVNGSAASQLHLQPAQKVALRAE